MAAPIAITIDCNDPAVLMRFWCQALGYVVQPPPDGYGSWLAYWRALRIPDEELGDLEDDGNTAIIDPAGVGPRIWFQPVPEPKVVKNRVHIDIKTFDRSEPLVSRRPKVDAEVSRLVGLGATIFNRLDPADSEYYAVVLQDPEGNEFCVG